MIGELQTICRTVGDDIGDLRALMDDAVSNLTRTFQSIAESARKQQRAQVHADGDAKARFASDIGRQAERAALYLQFHDRAAQMMDNLERRARAVEQGTAHILAGDLPAAAKAFEQTSSIRERQPRNAAVEDSGEIELF